jgi:hypothetical protein
MSIRKSAAHDTPATADASPRHPALDRIDDALRGLRYGSVLAIVQDGVVVQIERTEKTRLPFPEKR